MGYLFAQHSKPGLPVPDAPENEGVAFVRQILDRGPGVANGDLLEGHDVPQRAQRVLAAEHALEVAETVPVEQPDYGAHPRRVGEDADSVEAVEQRPGKLGLGLEPGSGHPEPGSVVDVEPQGLSGSGIAKCHASHLKLNPLAVRVLPPPTQ